MSIKMTLSRIVLQLLVVALLGAAASVAAQSAPTTAPVAAPVAPPGLDPCTNPDFKCRRLGGLVKGQLIYRNVLGVCVKRCKTNDDAAVPAGWKCGACLD